MHYPIFILISLIILLMHSYDFIFFIFKLLFQSFNLGFVLDCCLFFFFYLLDELGLKQFFKLVLSVVKVDHVLVLIFELTLILLLSLYIRLHLFFQHGFHLINTLFFLHVFPFFLL